MRVTLRKRQNVWFCSQKPIHVGADTAYEYSKPELRRFGDSATSGWISGSSAGLLLDYDRYIVCYDRTFHPSEGSMVFIDVVPELDADGNLKISDDGVTPVTAPDYMIKKIVDTQRGKVARFELKKV